MPASDVVLLRYSAFQVHFRCARAGRLFSYSIPFPCMLYRAYRVRATRRRGKSKALVLLSCALLDTPASREQRPRFTCPEKRREHHTACLRVRGVSAQGAAVWTGKNGRQYGMSARRCDRRCRKNTRILSFLRRTGNGISLASSLLYTAVIFRPYWLLRIMSYE